MAYFECPSYDSTVLSLPTPSEASGAIAQFNTDLTENLLHAVAEFNASQDLHGQASPYPAGGGKNKANFVNGYGISISGEVEANLARFATVETIPIKSGETYYVKKMQSGACSFIVAVYNGSTLVRRVSGLNSGDTIDTTGGDNFRVAGYSSSGSVTFEAVEAMVVTDNTVSAYSPYANICPIIPVSSVNITRTEKNLIEGIDNNILGLSNNIITYASGTGTIIKTRLVAGQSYIISGVTKNRGIIAYFDNMPQINDTTSKYQSFGNSSYTFTADYSGFALIYIANSVIDTTTAQLEFGSTATTYEAPTVVNIIINLGGNYYGGYVDAVTGKITLTHKSIILDGTQTVTIAVQAYIKSDACDGYINVEEIFPRVSPMNQPDRFAMCDKLLPVKQQIWNTTGYPNCMTINQKQIHLNIANDLLGITDYTQETIATAKAKIQSFLQSNPIEVMYRIEPIVVYASNTAEIPTLNGLNQVYADTGNVAVEYFETVKSALY